MIVAHHHSHQSGSELIEDLESDDQIREHLKKFMIMSETKLFKFNSTNRDHHNRIDPDNYLVPNIVHYVWFGGYNTRFRFDNMLSVLSAYKILQPSTINLHTDVPPQGPYWDFVKQIPTLKIVPTQPPRELFGEIIQKPYYETSDSNLYRVKLIWEQGGIYLDTDVIVINKMDNLRNHSCTLGYELLPPEETICGGVIMGAKHSTFLYLWLNSFLDDYKVGKWAYNSGKVPSKLAKRYPETVNIVPDKFHRPNWQKPHIGKIWFNQTCRWWENYTIHLWYRKYREAYKGPEPSLSNIKQWKGTFGQIARFILCGEKRPGA